MIAKQLRISFPFAPEFLDLVVHREIPIVFGDFVVDDDRRAASFLRRQRLLILLV